jgi:hypothetical protein
MGDKGLESNVSASEIITAVHTGTGLVSEIPRSYLTLGHFRELSEDQVIELRRKAEKELFGDYITPAPKPKAVAKPAAPTKEGGK